MRLSMGKVVGGGASINVMAWARGHKNDWDFFASESGDTILMTVSDKHVVSGSSILAPPYCKRSRSEGGYQSWKSLREIKYNPREITGPLTCLYTAVGMEAGVGSAYVRPSKMPATRSSRLALRELANALISTRPRSTSPPTSPTS